MDIEDLPLIGPDGVNGLVPKDAQVSSLPFGIFDDAPTLVGPEEFYRFVCGHCGQAYNVRAKRWFLCQGCGKRHPYASSHGVCSVFGCVGNTEYERDITFDGKPTTYEHEDGEPHDD